MMNVAFNKTPWSAARTQLSTDDKATLLGNEFQQKIWVISILDQLGWICFTTKTNFHQ